MTLIEIMAGPQAVIYSLDYRSKPVHELLMKWKKQHTNEFGKLSSLLELSCNNGIPYHNKQRVSGLTGYPGLYEFKPFPFRIFFFKDGVKGARDVIICCHAIIKKKNQTDVVELSKADERMKEYFRSNQSHAHQSPQKT